MGKIIKVNKNKYIVDYALVNVINRFDQTLLEVRNQDSVLYADPILAVTNVKIVEIDNILNQVVSMEPEKVGDYFNYILSEDFVFELNKDVAIIILPSFYNIIYDLNIGDIIHLDINSNNSHLPIQLAGFYENSTEQVAITNIHRVYADEEFKPNIILIKEKNNYFGLKEVLIDRYSKNLEIGRAHV